MFARFKIVWEPIDRPYCYLLFVICYFWGWCFWRADMCYDLIVICYLLFLRLVFLGEQTCVTTLLLFVICYLLFLREHKYADPFRESVFLRHVPPIPPQPGAKRAPRQTDREPWTLATVERQAMQ